MCLGLCSALSGCWARQGWDAEAVRLAAGTSPVMRPMG